MAFSQVPRTPVAGVAPRMAVRRSVTVPSKLQSEEPKPAAVAIGAAEGIETLYIHPSARIVTFNTSTFASGSPTRKGSDTGETGFLSWRSPTERTLAAEEDLRLVEEFKITLQKVLHYERTACPFKRGFSVELPEGPLSTPRRKSRTVSGPAKKWKLNGVWRPEDEEKWKSGNSREDFNVDSGMQLQHDEASDSVEDGDLTVEEDRWNGSDGSDMETPKPRKPSSLRSTRSVTAPPKLTLIASPPSKMSVPMAPQSFASSKAGEAPQIATEPGDASLAANLDQGLDVDSTISTTDTRPALKQSPTLEPECPASAISQTTESGLLSEDDIVEGRIWSAISTPSLSSDSEGHSWGEIITPPETLRVKKNPNRSRVDTKARASSQTRFTRRGSRDSQTALADGIVRKTVGIFLGPPAHLVSMMLRIAAKISNGAFNFTIKSPLGTPQKVPGSWYLAEDEDEWDIDDYGFPIGLPGSAQQRALRKRNAE
ncbi:hypothetical protein ANO11243_037430 [Dothideomycetidae sp. 11243]|nr:hypothetical protein ANO11243_037430 [fungal sp. No.11243]